jgi:hypothetical protein
MQGQRINSTLNETVGAIKVNEKGFTRRKLIGKAAQMTVAAGMAGLIFQQLGSGHGGTFVQGDASSPNPPNPEVTTTATSSASVTSATSVASPGASAASANNGTTVPAGITGDLAGVLSLQSRSTDPPNIAGLYLMYIFDDTKTRELRIKNSTGNVTAFPLT